MKKVILVLILVISSVLSASIEYDEVYHLYKSKQYKEAMKEFKILADVDKDADAAYMIGQMYEAGEGVVKNQEEADKWYKLSSKLYYGRAKHSVNKEVDLNQERLYNTLQKIDDKETRQTVYQYMHSIFNLKAHKTNYLLPISTRVNGDYDDNNPNGRDTASAEVEFQVSVKYDFLPNLFGLHELYTVAYTQHSFWQYYVGDAYFRASDYNPEFYVTFPMEYDYFKAIRVSIAHQSNGLGEPGERAWNYATLSGYFQYKSLFTELQFWHRFQDNHDYNPDLIDTMGYGHIKFMLPYKKHFVSVLLRNNFHGKGAFDAGYSYPLFGESLFLYVKAFAGYGESMITYAGSHPDAPHEDDYVERVGIGFSLSR